MKSKFIIAIIAIAAVGSIGASENGIESCWLAFREYLPVDIQKNLDHNLRDMDFELLSKVLTIEDQTWCDMVAVYIPISDEADEKYRQFWNSFGKGISEAERDRLLKEAIVLAEPTMLRQQSREDDLMQQCRATAERHPQLTLII